MVKACKLHPYSAAHYRCEGCGALLCDACIEESHVLLLCRLCGERAWPVDEDQPATVRELDKARRRARPYSLGAALFYPFRGANVYLFLMVLICLTVVGALWLLFIVLGFLKIFSWLAHAALWVMIVDLQYKIVRATADGDNDIPDWADVADLSSLMEDAVRSLALDLVGLRLLALSVTWWMSHALVIVSFGYFAEGLPGLLERFELGPGDWLALTVVFWLGVAFAVMVYGSAGVYSRSRALHVHRHVQGFVSAGGDAIWITNTVFFLGASVTCLQFLLGDVPLLGAAASSVIAAYWALVFPHLVGFLFRRHRTKMDRIYDSRSPVLTWF